MLPNAGTMLPRGEAASPENRDRAASLEARAYNDLIDFLYAQSASGRFTPVIVFIVCSFLFLPHAPWWSLPLILAFQLGGTGLAEILRRRHKLIAPEADRRPWAIGYMWVSGICGVSWGIMGGMWLVPDLPELQVVLALVLIGGVTGSLVARSPHLPSLAVFLVALGTPFVVCQLWLWTPESIAVGILSVVYAIGIQGWAKGLNSMYRREAMARLRSQDLVRDLELARDTAEARAEEAEEARHAAEAGARAKSEFLSTISHEVRTPLNGIQGMAELMQDTDLSDMQQECLTTIRESADSLGVVLDDIIEISLHESGTADYELRPFDPEALAAQVIRIIEPDARRKALSLNLIVPPDIPRSVSGDEKRCRQVLLNLVGNAVKFTDEGHVSVRVGMGHMTKTNDPMIRFTVQDTGIGIRPENTAKLFKDFEQIDQSHTRRHGGRGLGLALVQRIVGQMHGDVGVRSTFGEGSEFWFDVPLEKAAAAPERNATSGHTTATAQQVEGYVDMFGPEKAQDIIEACLDSVWELTEKIEVARRSGDVEAVGSAAHDLRSIASNIGFTQMEARAGAIEAAVRSHDADTALSQAAQLPGDAAMAQADFATAHPQFAAARR